jgi:hypothetical protein
VEEREVTGDNSSSYSSHSSDQYGMEEADKDSMASKMLFDQAELIGAIPERNTSCLKRGNPVKNSLLSSPINE